jgi:hypothetical protein
MTETAKALVKTGGGLVVGSDEDLDELMREAANDVGAGTSSAREDNLIPFLAILQDGSPQVKKREAKYIDGAEAGMILKTDTGLLIPGDVGAMFQPCYRQKKFVEWVPRADAGGGAGFAGYQEERPADAREKPDKPNKWYLPNGNDIVETHYYYGNLLVPELGRIDPCVIGMSSTQISVSRAWNSLMRSIRIGGSVIPPVWFRAYMMTTSVRQNQHGSWYVWKPTDQGWVNSQLRKLGKELHDSIASGEKTAADPDVVEGVAEQEVPF